MKSREALRVLAEVSESQWGLVTSAQANARGVSHMNLTRLSESGDLVRLSHGVYRDAGAPGGQHEELRAAWLATEPAKLAYERLSESPATAVVSAESATRLHGIGDLRAMRSEFTTPSRKQTQRPDVRYRTRVLSINDVTIREGLPVTTVERTIADLVEERNDLSIVSNVLRDAARKSRLNSDRLTELLGPLAERNGYRKGDGAAFLEELLRIAGINHESIATQMAAIPSLGSLITAKYLESLPKVDFTPFLQSFAMELPTLTALGGDQKHLAAMSEALSTRMLPDLSKLVAAVAAASGLKTIQARLAEQLTSVAWADLAVATQAHTKSEEASE